MSIGAWWYNNCHDSNLNGHYYQQNDSAPRAKGVVWKHWKGYFDSLKAVSMKVRPAGFIPPGETFLRHLLINEVVLTRIDHDWLTYQDIDSVEYFYLSIVNRVSHGMKCLYSTYKIQYCNIIKTKSSLPSETTTK